MVNNAPSCSCLPEFLGSPPGCRPECVSNSECPSQFACINRKCENPCRGSCSSNADCYVLNHTPMCSCTNGYSGDAFVQCVPFEPPRDPSLSQITPCDPSPCGANAICRVQNNAGSCSCLPEYIGNPYDGCRPECTVNTDCSANLACIRSKCQDPCPGTCGTNAECQVVSHLPNCVCLPGYSGNPFQYCNREIAPGKFLLVYIY